jgi:hypothetical protein
MVRKCIAIQLDDQLLTSRIGELCGEVAGERRIQTRIEPSLYAT